MLHVKSIIQLTDSCSQLKTNHFAVFTMRLGSLADGPQIQRRALVLCLDNYLVCSQVSLAMAYIKGTVRGATNQNINLLVIL